MTCECEARRIVTKGTADEDFITDFDDGVDAIEFLIDSFGFENLDEPEDTTGLVEEHGCGRLRLIVEDGVDLETSAPGLSGSKPSEGTSPRFCVT